MNSRPVVFKPEWVFLVLGLLAGGLMCVFIPFGAGFDEETHLVRVYDLAGLHLLPNRSAPGGSYAPGEFYSLSYQRRALQTPANDLFGSEVFWHKIDRDNPTLTQTRSVYPPPGLAAQALIARLIWLKYDVALIPGTILLRLAGLMVYLAGTWLAIRLLPFGKWVFAVLALAPMALFAAATVNVDGFTNAVSFLFIASVLRSAHQKGQSLPWRDVLGVCALVVLLGLAKPGAVFVLPLLVLLFRRGTITRWQGWAIVLSAVAALLLTLGWNSVALAGSHFDAGGEQSAGRQLDLILAAPFAFVLTFFQALGLRLGDIYLDWVGVYGHWLGEVPAAVYLLYPLALAGTLTTENKHPGLTPARRWVILVVFFAAAGATELLFFSANYTPGDLSSLGRQGRYFTPFTPLLFIPLTGLAAWPSSRRRWVGAACAWFLLGTLALYGYGLYATYYTYCGATSYTGKACVQPIYKNLDRETAPEVRLAPGDPFTQSITTVCDEVTWVEALVRSVPDNMDGSLSLSVAANDGGVMASREVPFTELQPGQYLGLALSPGMVPAGKLAHHYNLRIELQSGETGPGFATSYGDDYPGGSLFIAGNQRGIDLIFHYSCALPRASGSR